MTEGRKHRAYTLWMKFRNTGWIPRMTVAEVGGAHTLNPRAIIKDHMRHTTDGISYWKRGKTWMIKPEGIKPAALTRQEDEEDYAN